MPVVPSARPATAEPQPPTHTPSVTPVPSDTAAPEPTSSPTPVAAGSHELGALGITIVYDNTSYDPRLKSDWGFGAWLEYAGHIILFDTGAKGDLLLGNMAKLDLDPLDIDLIVLSHEHGDHTGGLDGMYSYTGFMPEENVGVVILTNRDTHNLMRAVAYHLYDLYLKADFQDWSRRYYDAYQERLAKRTDAKRKRDDGRVTGTTPSHNLSDYAGQYEDAVYGAAEIQLSNDTLVIHPKAHPDITGKLEHWHYDTFLCRWSNPIWDESLLYFDLGDDGRVGQFRVTVRPDWIDTREYRFVRM